MITKNFEDFAAKHNIIFAIIVDLEKEIDFTFGSKDALVYEGLYNSLFGDRESILRLNESLKGQIMPQSWKQGELKCLIAKPNDKILVGLFYIDTQNAIESYKIGKQINNELIELWEI